MYEVTYVWRSNCPRGSEVLERHEIKPVRVTREGILPGCAATSISVTGSDGRKFNSSSENYFDTEAAALAHIREELVRGIEEQKEAVMNEVARLSNLERLLAEIPSALRGKVNDSLDKFPDGNAND
jgi:hypothetical protein